MAELFKPLPSMVVAHYLGVPEEDRGQFDGWTDAIVAANLVEGGIGGRWTPPMPRRDDAYFTALIERRRSNRPTTPCRIWWRAGVGVRR